MIPIFFRIAILLHPVAFCAGHCPPGPGRETRSPMCRPRRWAQSLLHRGHRPRRADAGLWMFVLRAVQSCRACRVSPMTPFTAAAP